MQHTPGKAPSRSTQCDRDAQMRQERTVTMFLISFRTAGMIPADVRLLASRTPSFTSCRTMVSAASRTFTAIRRWSVCSSYQTAHRFFPREAGNGGKRQGRGDHTPGVPDKARLLRQQFPYLSPTPPERRRADSTTQVTWYRGGSSTLPPQVKITKRQTAALHPLCHLRCRASSTYDTTNN